MTDTSAHLALPYLMAAQAQKHVTLNEALRLIDGIVQLSVRDRDLTAPPASPAEGDRYIPASGATGLWAGWDANVALWADGAWMKLIPGPGWLAWVEDEGVLLVHDGSAWRGHVLDTLRAALVGEVSQDSGTPTGAVIERGNNSNGHYTRWADGTQMCWAKPALTYDNASQLKTTWTYPAAFASGVTIVTTATLIHATAVGVGPGPRGLAGPFHDNGTNTAQPFFVRSIPGSADFGAANTVSVCAQAMGRWF